MTVPGCLDLLVLQCDLASLKIASFYAFPWLFGSPWRSLIWVFASCLITCVLESLPGQSPFPCNANINPLQCPLTRIFFSYPSQTGILAKPQGEGTGSLSCFATPSCTFYLKKWCSEIMPLWVIPWSPEICIFCYGFNSPGGVIRVCPQRPQEAWRVSLTGWWRGSCCPSSAERTDPVDVGHKAAVRTAVEAVQHTSEILRPVYT